MMPVCVVTPEGWCERHQKIHKNTSLRLCLEDSEAGERHRALQDWMAGNAPPPGAGTIMVGQMGTKRVSGLAPMPQMPRPTKQRKEPPPEPSFGPGTELKAMLKELGIMSSPTCGCNTKARQMDVWGVEGCKKHKEEIVAWMVENQDKYKWRHKVMAGFKSIFTGLAFKIDLLNPYQGIVEEAIRRAETKQEKVKVP